jgi:hypothetical protein
MVRHWVLGAIVVVSATVPTVATVIATISTVTSTVTAATAIATVPTIGIPTVVMAASAVVTVIRIVCGKKKNGTLDSAHWLISRCSTYSSTCGRLARGAARQRAGAPALQLYCHLHQLEETPPTEGGRQRLVLFSPRKAPCTHLMSAAANGNGGESRSSSSAHELEPPEANESFCAMVCVGSRRGEWDGLEKRRRRAVIGGWSLVDLLARQAYRGDDTNDDGHTVGS